MNLDQFRSPVFRLLAGAADVTSLLLFGGVWVATLVTSGFSLSATHTFAGWTYFPIFWPHLAAATIGFLLFLRYGANFATALVTVILWLAAFLCDIYGAVLYWRTFWLCNIGGKSTLDAVGTEICASENALLISLMVLGTILWVITWIGIIGHVADFFQAGRSGSAAPRFQEQISGALLLILFVGVITLLLFLALIITDWITSSISIGGGHTYAVWTHANILLLQLPAGILSIMLFLRYGANWVTAAAAIILWGASFFAGLYCAALYWRLGWMCFVSTSSTLTGIDLTICTDEENYLIAVWVMVSILFLLAIVGPIVHAFDFFRAGRSGSVNIRIRSGRKNNMKDSDLEFEDPQDSLVPTDTDPNANNMDQLAPFNDGSMLTTAAQAATRGWQHAVRNNLPSVGVQSNIHDTRNPTTPADAARGGGGAAIGKVPLLVPTTSPYTQGRQSLPLGKGTYRNHMARRPVQPAVLVTKREDKVA